MSVWGQKEFTEGGGMSSGFSTIDGKPRKDYFPIGGGCVGGAMVNGAERGA